MKNAQFYEADLKYGKLYRDLCHDSDLPLNIINHIFRFLGFISYLHDNQDFQGLNEDIPIKYNGDLPCAVKVDVEQDLDQKLKNLIRQREIDDSKIEFLNILYDDSLTKN